MSDHPLFTTYEKLNTCRRTEVTLENLHLLAQHFKGSAVYAEDPDGNWQTKKPHVFIPERAGGTPGIVEVGSWVDDRGSRWSPEPLTQGYSPAGTYHRDPMDTQPTEPTPCKDSNDRGM